MRDLLDGIWCQTFLYTNIVYFNIAKMTSPSIQMMLEEEGWVAATGFRWNERPFGRDMVSDILVYKYSVFPHCKNDLHIHSNDAGRGGMGSSHWIPME